MARLNVDIRTNESPMDFQWQQGHGPANSDSPFMKIPASSQQQLNGFAGHKRESDRLSIDTQSQMLIAVFRFIQRAPVTVKTLASCIA